MTTKLATEVKSGCSRGKPLHGIVYAKTSNDSFQDIFQKLHRDEYPLKNRDTQTMELLQRYKCLSKDVKLQYRDKVRNHLLTRFGVGCLDLEHHRMDKGKRQCVDIVKSMYHVLNWKVKIHSLDQHAVSMLYKKQMPRCALLAFSRRELPENLQCLLSAYYQSLNGPFSVLWQWQIHRIVSVIECIFDTTMSISVLKPFLIPFVKSGSIHLLSRFSDFISQHQVFPWNYDEFRAVRSVRVVFNDDCEIQEYYESVIPSVIFLAKIIMQTLKTARSSMICSDQQSTGQGREEHSSVEVFSKQFMAASCANACNNEILKSLYNDCSGVSEEVHNEPGIYGCNSLYGDCFKPPPCVQQRSYIEDLKSISSEADAAAGTHVLTDKSIHKCDCTEDLPSLDCLFYRRWLCDTITSRLMSVISNQQQTRLVIINFMNAAKETLTTNELADIRVLETFYLLKDFADFECSHSLAASVNAVERLSGGCLLMQQFLSDNFEDCLDRISLETELLLAANSPDIDISVPMSNTKITRVLQSLQLDSSLQDNMALLSLMYGLVKSSQDLVDMQLKAYSRMTRIGSYSNSDDLICQGGENNNKEGDDDDEDDDDNDKEGGHDNGKEGSDDNGKEGSDDNGKEGSNDNGKEGSDDNDKEGGHDNGKEGVDDDGKKGGDTFHGTGTMWRIRRELSIYKNTCKFRSHSRYSTTYCIHYTCTQYCSESRKACHVMIVVWQILRLRVLCSFCI